MKTSTAIKKLSMTAAGIAFFAGTVVLNAQQAVAVVLLPNGVWQSGQIESDPASNNPTSWDFTIAPGFQGAFDLVDQFIAGDVYDIYNGATLLGSSDFTPKTPPFPYLPSGNPGLDADWAAASTYSSASLLFGPGSYSLSLAPSSTFPGGLPAGYSVRLNQTAVAVPEPASVLGLLAIGVLGAGSALKRKLK
ncbi:MULTISPECIES: PEP-CTERM sorting domain-containing protein [Microcystis]|uniref:PEP-CTERM sorting domain-containing protein n=1 Tax=Microcystis TaxID=1125 RepID=UPI000691F959|nr:MULTISPECIES: PEP-CTERM sorting domain-containing protein [Microcystis]MDB9407815.1 PEP-CTERM sorting domain-containing protein [Microcystis aeruginosa CS-558/01A06]